MNQKAVMAMTPRNRATSRGHCGRGTRLWLMDRVGGGRLLRRRHANGGNHQEENDENDGELKERLLQASTGSHEGAALKAAHPFALHLEQDDSDEGYRDQYLSEVEVVSQCHLQTFGLYGLLVLQGTDEPFVRLSDRGLGQVTVVVDTEQGLGQLFGVVMVAVALADHVGFYQSYPIFGDGVQRDGLGA